MPLQYSSQPYRSSQIESESVHELLNGGMVREYEGVEISADIAGLIYERDAIARRACNYFGNSMSIADWQINCGSSEIAAYIRDALLQLDLFTHLGNATNKATVFSESFLVLDSGWEQQPKIWGVYDYGRARMRDVPSPGSALLRVTTESSLARFLKYFQPYLEVSNNLHLLALVSSFCVIEQDELAKDLKRVPPDQQQQYMLQRLQAFSQGMANRGTVLVSGGTKVELFHQKADVLIEALDKLQANMISATGGTYQSILGYSKEGQGLSSINLTENMSLSETNDTKRKQEWTIITNWIIDRLLLRIGETPGIATIEWLTSLRLQAEEESRILMREANAMKVFVEMEAITPSEVRNSKFRGSKTAIGQINLEDNEVSPLQEEINDALEDGQELRNLYKQYKETVNVGSGEYSSKVRQVKNVDKYFFNRTKQLLKCNEEDFLRSQELQQHAIRTIGLIHRSLSCSSIDDLLLKKNLLCWGLDLNKQNKFKRTITADEIEQEIKNLSHYDLSGEELGYVMRRHSEANRILGNGDLIKLPDLIKIYQQCETHRDAEHVLDAYLIDIFKENLTPEQFQELHFMVGVLS